MKTGLVNKHVRAVTSRVDRDLRLFRTTEPQNRSSERKRACLWLVGHSGAQLISLWYNNNYDSRVAPTNIQTSVKREHCTRRRRFRARTRNAEVAYKHLCVITQHNMHIKRTIHKHDMKSPMPDTLLRCDVPRHTCHAHTKRIKLSTNKHCAGAGQRCVSLPMCSGKSRTRTLVSCFCGAFHPVTQRKMLALRERERESNGQHTHAG